MLARYRMFAGYNAGATNAYMTRPHKSRIQTIVPIAVFSLSRCTAPSTISWLATASGCGALAVKASPPRLDAILHDDFAQLRVARRAEDERISHYIGTLSADDLAKTIRYRNVVNPRISSRRSRPRSIIFSTTRLTTAAMHC